RKGLRLGQPERCEIGIDGRAEHGRPAGHHRIRTEIEIAIHESLAPEVRKLISKSNGGARSFSRGGAGSRRGHSNAKSARSSPKFPLLSAPPAKQTFMRANKRSCAQ